MKGSILLKALLALALAQAVALADDSVDLRLPNMRQPAQHRIVSGAIDATDLGRMRAAGIKHVINLRTAKESTDFDEARIAAGLGLHYHSIPIEGAQSLTRENAAKLDELLKLVGDEPTLVHCGSGNRVGAMVALREAWINGKSTDAAIAEGKRWGLTSLEHTVRTQLQDASKPKQH
jgi:uncharacterized protein (TIGR01244 family)